MNPSRFPSVVFFVLVVLTGPSAGGVPAAEPWPLDTPPVDPRVRQLMQDRSYTEAARAIDQALQAPGARRDWLLYLKGRAFYLAKQYDAAIAVFDAMERESAEGAPGSSPARGPAPSAGKPPATPAPKADVPGKPPAKPASLSPWVRRARFAKAVAFARKGDFRSAAAIYRAEAESLLSPERRQEIAEVYLGFAAAYFKPPQQGQQPDYAKALEFFGQALAVGPGPERQQEVEFAVAECCRKLGNPAEAATRYARFIKDHPASPLDVEARYQLGECQLATGSPAGARRTWQDLLAKYPDARSPRIAEAAYHLARTWHIPQPQNDEQLNLGTAALEAFVERFPAHELAGRAHLDVAQSFVHRRRYVDAAARLDRFLKDERMKGRKEIPEAWFLLGQVHQFQKKFAEAVAAWREYLARFPAHERWNAAQQEIVNTEYLAGLEKYKAKDYAAAEKVLGDFLARYPLDPRGPDILLLFGRMRHEQGQFDAAIAQWRQLISKHPNTEEACFAQFLIARTLERDLGKLDEALEEYRRVAGGSCQADAQQSVARLLATTMAVWSPRAFRSNEVPKLTLTTRNVESVTVRAYKLDLETYFRRVHTIGRIETLDIGLIDPDFTLEFKVPHYARYRRITSEIPLAMPQQARSGVMAVTVGGKALEATALVLQSDLEVIVKSSAGEVFVFAENMVTKQPWPGVRVLISDGGRIVAESQTGQQGILKQPLREAGSPDRLGVFAVAGGHVASTQGQLRGITAVRGLVDKGYLYTDRPVYRAGQEVRVRGCLRHVAGDAYVVKKDAKYALEVFDSRNRPVRQAEIVLGAFGTFADAFTLPVTSPQGAYRIVVRSSAGQSHQGTFRVLEHRQELVRLAIDAPQRVYYRGETIEGTIRASFYDGAPVAGREVRYQMARGESHTARTDAKGEVPFRFPTREFDESQTLPLSASLPEHNLQASANFFLAVQGFSLQLSTIRPVYLAGEPFELTVRTADAAGKPTAGKLQVQVLDTSPVGDKPGERLVKEFSLQTSRDDGLARHTLTLEKGGPYEIRVQGTDRFKNPVSAELALAVSDDRDDERLRILADRQTFKAGETAELQLVWREEPALALVTLEGARVLDARLQELRKGVNKLSIPLVLGLAPNFELAVAVMADLPPAKDGEKAAPRRRLHQASVALSVERELSVRLALRRKAAAAGPLRPGEELEVLLATADPLGKPVPAELSLAMIEQSLVDRAGSAAGPIQDFFRGPRREGTIPTTASITWADEAKTTPLNPRLVAERERQQIAEEEEASRQAPLPGVQAGADRGPEELSDLPAAPPGNPQLAHLIDVVRGVDEEGFGPAQDLAGGRARGTRRGRMMGHGMGGMAGMGGMGGMAGMAGFAAPGPVKLPPVPSAEPRPRLPAASSAATVPPGEAPIEEAGYWDPAVVTGKDGTAHVRLVIPDRPAAWALVAKGITLDTLAGEAVERLVAKKDFYAELKLPRAFTEGDEALVPVTVHNEAIDQGPIEVALRTSIGGRTIEEKKTVEVKSKGRCEVSFAVVLRSAEKPEAGPAATAPSPRAVFDVAVAGKGVSDALRRTVPLLPFGAPVFAAAGGSAEADATVWVENPGTKLPANPRLQILVGPTVEAGLLDVLFGPAFACRPWCEPLDSPVETATSNLMASLALQKMLAASRDSGNPQAAMLDARARAALGVLILAEREDGGWSWSGSGGSSDPYASARAVWAIHRARQVGYPVAEEAFGKAIQYLRGQLTAAGAKDTESKAVLLCALAVAGKGDFTLANQLHRQRLQLSAAAQVHLALALVEMDRKPMAQEVLDAVAKSGLDATPMAGAAPGAAASALSSTGQSPIEIRALYALASQAVAPGGPTAKRLADWLLAHRTGTRWVPDKATGPATTALCAWFGESRFQGERYKLAVSVNGTAVQVLDVDRAASTRVIDVPAAVLAKDKQKVSFELTGRGRYTYQCILSGFLPPDQLGGRKTDRSIRRIYEPAPRELDGRGLPRGFDIVRDSARFRNAMSQLPVGRRGTVEISFDGGGDPFSETAEDLWGARSTYLVITDPIPSGAEVIESSVRGDFDRYEIGSGTITFYLGRPWGRGTIHYDLHGYLPGKYRVGPAVARNAYRPEQMAFSSPGSLQVLPLGAATTDPYRLSPRELLELGKALLAKGDRKAAAEPLTELAEKWNLHAEAFKEVVGMLLDIHLELGPPEKVVQYFEIVKDKWPEQEIPFAKILKVGAAYQAMGEFERSYLVFRATAESSFTRDSGVAGFLEGQGEFVRSVAFMERLFGEYPPEPYVAGAEYALAQRVSAKAGEAASDARLRRQKINRVDLLRRAWGMLESFLTAHPDDPAADQASFAAANVLLDLKDYAGAAAACRRYAARYPAGELVDAFWYLAGYCEFALGRHQEALVLCRKVADAQPIDKKTGRPVESPNKHRAIYIMGQIYHSLGQAADAIREYRRVADRFADARQAVALFLRKAIEIPEVTTVRPGSPTQLELRFRNFAACDVKVYRIDLMKFAVLKGDLGGIAGIHLAGIRPFHEATVKLGEGKDYRDRTEKLELPLKSEGAYLVLCRSEDSYASGLVLVTPLVVEVEADRAASQVRAMVKDVPTGRYLTNVHVKVIGSAGDKFVSGEPDLRGIFVAEGIRGAATVIAEAGPGRYAFWRDVSVRPAQGSSPSQQAGPPAGTARDTAAAAKPAAERPVAKGPVAEENPFDDVPSPKRPPGSPAPAPYGTGKTAGVAGRHPVAAKPRPRAQAPSAPIDMGGLGPAESEKRIREALKSPTEIRCADTPLVDLVQSLKQRHRIEIQLDSKALEELGVAADTPITRTLEGVSLRSALRLVLRDLGLTYTIQDEVLLITSPEVATSRIPTAVYPVGDLLLPPGATDEGMADFDLLINLIQNTVQPHAWGDSGGAGAIETSGLSLVISQNPEVHDEVARLLDELRRTKRGETRPSTPEDVRRIEAALDAPVQVDFKGTPLTEVIQKLAEEYRILIQLDGKALEESGVAADSPITRTLQGIALRSALDLLLRDLGLTYTIVDEVLLITSPDAAQSGEMLATVVYPVGDLVAFRDPSGEEWTDFDSLIEMMENSVAPDSWLDAGGSGIIQPFDEGRALVVTQTPRLHREVAQLLEKLRRAGGTVAGGPARVRAKPPGMYGGMPPGYAGFGGGLMGGMGGFGGLGGMGAGPAGPDQASFGMGGFAGGSGAARRGGAPARRGAGMGGGMGGMGYGGMPGVTPGARPPAATPDASGGEPPGPGQRATTSGASRGVDLLEGVRDANKSFQAEQLQRLHKRYQGGAGFGGMGGSGGGVGAGSAFQQPSRAE